MTTTQIFMLVVLAAICAAAIAVRSARGGRKSSPGVDAPGQVPRPGAPHQAAPQPASSRSTSRPILTPLTAHGEALRQNLRIKVTYDEAKIDRLIDYERSELKRKGEREAAVEDLMERAIGRWELENRR
jgi:hypothetical protein